VKLQLKALRYGSHRVSPANYTIPASSRLYYSRTSFCVANTKSSRLRDHSVASQYPNTIAYGREIRLIVRSGRRPVAVVDVKGHHRRSPASAIYRRKSRRDPTSIDQTKLPLSANSQDGCIYTNCLLTTAARVASNLRALGPSLETSKQA